MKKSMASIVTTMPVIESECENYIGSFSCTSLTAHTLYVFDSCNQCYKFDTHTDMEEASSYTLKKASKQGTLLSFTINGVTYGGSNQQGYSYNSNTTQVSSLAVVAAVILAVAFLARYRRQRHIVTTEGNLPLDQPVLQE